MKCFVLFLLVAFTAVVMAEEEEEPIRISTSPLQVPKLDPPKVMDSEEVQRVKRGHFGGGYASPYHGKGHKPYSSHYRNPYAYYRSNPHYGYRNRY